MPNDKKTFRKTLLKANTPTVNGRIYPRETLQKAVSDAQEAIQEGRLFGCLGTPDGQMRLADVSHRVSSMRLEGDKVVAEVIALDTPAGKILQELLKTGTPRLEPMGHGNVDGNMVVTGYSISGVNASKDND